ADEAHGICGSAGERLFVGRFVSGGRTETRCSIGTSRSAQARERRALSAGGTVAAATPQRVGKPMRLRRLTSTYLPTGEAAEWADLSALEQPSASASL